MCAQRQQHQNLVVCRIHDNVIYQHANGYCLPINLTDFLKCEGLTGVGYIAYGFEHLLNGMHVDNRTSVQSYSRKYFRCSQSATPKSHLIQSKYTSLHSKFLSSVHNKPAYIDIHMGSFAGRMYFCS